MADHDDFEEMPQPPRGQPQTPLNPALKAALQLRAEETEARQTHVLRRRGAWIFARQSDLYRRVLPGKIEDIGRARRILSPLTAACERHRYDEGSVAHVVTLGDPLTKPDATVQAWCGARLKTGQRWSDLRAFSTCSLCRSIAGPAIQDDQRGAVHRIAETDRYAARLQIDPKAQQEAINDYLEFRKKAEEDRRRNREQRDRLARRDRNPVRRAFRWIRSLAA